MTAPLAARRIGDRVRDRAHAAAHEAPQSAMAVHAAHAVVQQNVRRAGRARAAVGADHAVGGERDLDLLRLEPFVQKLRRALREDLHQPDDLGFREPAQPAGQLQILDEIADAARAENWEEW